MAKKSASRSAKSPATKPTVAPAIESAAETASETKAVLSGELVDVPADPPELLGAEEAFARYVPLALKLAEDKIVPCRADTILAYSNVRVGVEAILAESAVLKVHLPKVDLEELAALPEIARALMFAARQIDRSRKQLDLPALLEEARRLRKLLLTTAHALALSNQLPVANVEAIQRGRGMLDTAQDCVDLAALYRKYWDAVSSKVAFGLKEIDAAAVVGNEALDKLKPGRAKETVPKSISDAVNLRDRLWTLLVTRYDTLYRVSVYVFGRDADMHVPALQTARRTSKTDVVVPVANP